MTARKLVAVVPDLMDRSRLGGQADVELLFVPLADLADAVREPDVDLIVIDLSRPGALATLAGLPKDLPAPIIGFGPHVDDALLTAAATAGCTRVLPRSKFFARWPDV